MKEWKKPDLGLFGEDAGTGTEEGTGVNGQGDAAPAAGEKPALYTKRGTPIFAQSGAEGRDAAGGAANSTGEAEEFQQLIAGKYRPEYEASVSRIVQARLKGARDAEAILHRLEPVLTELGRRYEVDAADPARLDTQLLLNRMTRTDVPAAVQNGGTPVTNTDFRGMEEEGMERLRQQEAQAQAVYPRLHLQSELQNPEFSRLVRSGVPVRTAYEVIHQDEIIRGAMEFTARRVREKVAAGIRSHTVPLENGIMPQTPALTREDVRSKSCREEIKARMRRGEKVTL